MSVLSRFLRAESGAVTVDWVVLTAAIIGLSLSSAAAVMSGTDALSGDIETSLTDASLLDPAWDAWPNKGITNGICPGPAALEASYNELVAGGETFADMVADGAHASIDDSPFGGWMREAQANGFSADEFVVSYGWWQDGSGPGTPESREFAARFFACTQEASPTDWSTMPGGSFEGYLMYDFGFQLPPG